MGGRSSPLSAGQVRQPALSYFRPKWRELQAQVCRRALFLGGPAVGLCAWRALKARRPTSVPHDVDLIRDGISTASAAARHTCTLHATASCRRFAKLVKTSPLAVRYPRSTKAADTPCWQARQLPDVSFTCADFHEARQHRRPGSAHKFSSSPACQSGRHNTLATI